MTNKISYKEYCEARREMQKTLDEVTNELFPGKGLRGSVYVYADFGYREPVQTEVNWSAIGSVSAEDAVKFAKLLTKAAELAINFKYNGFTVYYDGEE